MNQMENRVIIRDTYGYKYFEVIQSDERTFVYDYGLGRFLGMEEITVVCETVKMIPVSISGG
jgi:hypothetical protein